MRVALAEDDLFIREGVTRLLERKGVTVAYAAGSGAELMRFLATDRPEAVLVDIKMESNEEGLDTAELIKEKYPKVGVLILSQYLEMAYVRRILDIREAGVGYLHKPRVSDGSMLLASLHKVAIGNLVLDPEMIAEYLRREAARSPLSSLSERERDALRLMAEGLSNRAIAGQMVVQERTIEGYLSAIYHKLGMLNDDRNNRRVLAVLAWLRERDTSP
jgi:DNA-binding NarL/FixJ family response regulator